MQDRAFAPESTDTQTPKILGVLHICFALLLMACVPCVAYFEFIPPLLSFAFQAEQARVDREIKERAVEIEKLEQQEKDAATAEEKAELKREREELAAAPPPENEMAGFADPRWRSPKYMLHFGADLASSLVLNLLMFIAGIGLVRLRNWARILANWVAVLKIMRLAVVAASLVFVIAPFVMELAATPPEPRAGAPAEKQSPDAANLATALQSAGIMITSAAVGLLLLGSVYPVITLWLLNVPSVRAAFRPRQRVSKQSGAERGPNADADLQ